VGATAAGGTTGFMTASTGVMMVASGLSAREDKQPAKGEHGNKCEDKKKEQPEHDNQPPKSS
jgi:hypothetical protein